MKKLLLTLTCLVYLCPVFGQDQQIESEVRALEQKEVQAILAKDSAVLIKLWAKDYVVNAPNNKIVFAGESPIDRPVMKNARTTFTREVEKIIVKDNVVFSMGNETLTPVGDQQSGKIVKRRYTNIWMKQDGSWKLVARHANVICQ